MFCSACGLEIGTDHRYCSRCGKATGGGQYISPEARPLTFGTLERDMANRKISGVCAGFAKWLGWDTTVVRILWLAIAIMTGVGFIVYAVCWAVMPRNDIRPMGMPYATSSGTPPV